MMFGVIGSGQRGPLLFLVDYLCHKLNEMQIQAVGETKHFKNVIVRGKYLG